MTTATQNKKYVELRLINHTTGKTSMYHLDPGESLKDLVSDALELDLWKTFSDNQQRSLVITANPQRRH